VYIALFSISILFSVISVGLLLREAKDLSALLLPALLLFSKAFVDFSTSGLEGPLTHLLLVNSILILMRDDVRESHRRIGYLLSGAIYLSRPDAMLLIFPIILYSLYTYSDRIKGIACFLLPGFGWTIFSIIYYGFPFPNTAYAKLNTGIPRSELFSQGMVYLFDSLRRDPLTLLMILASLGVVAFYERTNPDRRKRWLVQLLSLGIFLHIAYIVSIGGDFMSGRFLTPALVVATILLISVLSGKSHRYSTRLAIGLPLLVLGLFNIKATILAAPELYAPALDETGIVDERAFYFKENGLISAERLRFRSPRWDVGKRGVKTTCGGLGQMGISEGPSVHLIDTCGLSDPLLARLPMRESHGVWRIGHFVRKMPLGYFDSIEADQNLLSDNKTKDYYEQIRLITRGEIWNSERFLAMARVNLGFVKIDRELYRTGLLPTTPDAVVVIWAEVWDRSRYRQKFDTEGVPFSRRIEIQLTDQTNVKSVTFRIRGKGTMLVEAMTSRGEYETLSRVSVLPGEVGEYRVPFPDEPVFTERIRISALTDGQYELHQMTFTKE
jgi:arabinofuranosyltransferase